MGYPLIGALWVLITSWKVPRWCTRFGQVSWSCSVADSTQLSILVIYEAFALICKIKVVPLTPETLPTSLAVLQISMDLLFILIKDSSSLVSDFKCLHRVQEFLTDTRKLDTTTQVLGGSCAFGYCLETISQSLAKYNTCKNLVEVNYTSFSWKLSRIPARKPIFTRARPSLPCSDHEYSSSCFWVTHQ